MSFKHASIRYTTLMGNEKRYTPEGNMEPDNEGLEDDFPCETGDFQVPC